MNATLTALAPLTKNEVQRLAADWYQKLDVHAPLVEVLPMLAQNGLEMRFPEATLRSIVEFENWYEGVIRIFFDEVHTLREVAVELDGDKANVKVVVHWEASVWRAPAARSQRIMLDAYQTWVVARSPETGRPVIERYVVDRLDFLPGSAKL
jgi:hypothetical protein